MKAWIGLLTCLLIASWSGARCQTVMGRTFLLFTDGRTWSDAWTRCHSQGYRLLFLDSPTTLNALDAFVDESLLTDKVKESVWIGLSKDEESEDDFRWDDCLALNSSFTKWPSDEPVNTDSNSCVYMETDTFVWRTDSCQSYHQYLCEKDTGPCTYTYTTGACGATSKDYNKVEKQQDCEELCNTEMIYGAPCWVYNYNDEKCTLYFDEDPFRCAQYLDNRTILAGLRNCFEFEVLSSSWTLISQRVLKCNAATTATTTSATTVVAAATTTSTATTDETTTTTTSATTATSTATGAARTTTTTSAATTHETTTTTTSATTATSTATGAARTTTTPSAATTDTTITTTTTSAATTDEITTTTTSATTATFTTTGAATTTTTSAATTDVATTTTSATTTEVTATTATITTSPTTTDATTIRTSATTAIATVSDISTGVTKPISATSSSKATTSSTQRSTPTINGAITIAATDSSAVTNISLYNAAANTTSTVSISTRSTTVATGPSGTNADTTTVTSTTSPSLTSAVFTPTAATAHSNPTSSVVTTVSTTPAFVSSQVSNTATPSVESTNDACPCMICIPVRNMTLIDDFVKNMIDRLKVDQSTLSSKRRMRESEPDDRPSAQAIGYGGILFLVFTFSIIVVVDFTRICQVRNKRIPERQKKKDPNC